MFQLNQFINTHVTKRNQSMFLPDINIHADSLRSVISNSTVLVIGGAGSIGSSFIRAILPFRPSSLTVVDISENGLTELTRDLRSTYDLYMPESYITYPMDYASSVFEKMFRHHHGFDIVANFSAHKHVRSEKDIFSVEALFRNNVLNAKKLLDLLELFPPSVYFCVSTDKAANPVNLMGASKRIMEDLIFSYSDSFPVKTARFANVAFSNGSLPDGFLSRIAKRQPIGAPSDVKRYFVSPEESGQICMLSCMLGNNREIFFPKLDESQMMSFDEIARELLREYGYDVLECEDDEAAKRAAADILLSEDAINGHDDGTIDGTGIGKKYPVHFSKSNTSGEKPYEEFYTDSETVDMERFESLGVVTGIEKPDRQKLEKLLGGMEKLFDREGATKENVVELVGSYLPEFSHIEMGHSLDEKM